MKDLIQNARLIQPMALPYQREWFPSNSAYYARRIHQHIIGVTDYRARKGYMYSLTGTKTSRGFELPELSYTDKSINEIADSRALEIFSNAKKLNKRLLILWSGGIDSTFVLTSFLKNLDAADRDIITVCCNMDSIFENTQFYIDNISNKLNCMHYNSEFKIDNNLLSEYIIVHGDPGDCIFGPSLPAYRKFIDDGVHTESYKKHYQDLLTSIPDDPAVIGFGSWFVDQITNNLEEVKPDNVESIADWWWWTYINFKWEFSCQRPLFFSRVDYKESFSNDVLDEFAANTYFNTPDWQCWSYSNLRTLIPAGTGSEVLQQHKALPKQYINDYSPNLNYVKYKTKVSGAPADVLTRQTAVVPVFFDSNWKGYYLHENGVKEAFEELMKEQK